MFLNYLLEGIEKLSVDYVRDWAEAVFFAYSGQSSSVTSVIPAYILDGFKQLLRSQSAVVVATATAVTADTNPEEGFSLQGKVLLLVKAILQADLSASVTSSEIGDAFVNAVNDTTGSVISPYRTSRIEIASILSILIELSPTTPDLSPVRSRIVAACASLKYSGDKMDVETSLAEVEITTESDQVSKAANTQLKNASETACIWIQFLVQRMPLWKFESELVDLLSVAVQGTSNGDLELVKMCHDTSVFVSKSLISMHHFVPAVVSPDQLMQRILKSFDGHSLHASWRVRETVMQCLSIVMVNNWCSLSAEQKKICKDVYAKGINDLKPEVMHVAKAGMVAYLAYKTSNELKTIAEAYIKNSDALAVR